MINAIFVLIKKPLALKSETAKISRGLSHHSIRRFQETEKQSVTKYVRHDTSKTQILMNFHHKFEWRRNTTEAIKGTKCITSNQFEYNNEKAGHGGTVQGHLTRTC